MVHGNTRGSTDEDTRAIARVRLHSFAHRLTNKTKTPSEMPSTQSVYVSMSILALTGLVGTGVAIGSGVSMMTMQMAEAVSYTHLTLPTNREV